MAAARFGEGATFPIIGSLVLHIVFIGLLVAGRMGTEQPAEAVAGRDTAAPGEAALPVDLHSFRGAHRPGRPAPDESREMTAATVPGVPDALLGTSDRTIVPTEPSPTSPPGVSDSTPSAVGTMPSLIRRAGQGSVPESRPIVRAPQAAPTAEPGASDLALAATRVSHTPLPGMPVLKVQPVAPIAAAAPQRPASPKPGPADQTVIPSVDTVPAPVADAPRPAVMPDVMLQNTTPGSVPGPGLSNRTTIPLDVLAVPTPPKPADTRLPPPPPPKPVIARTVAPAAAKPAPAKPVPRPKPRVVRPPPPQPAEPTPDMVVIPPEPEPVVALPASPPPPPPAAASPRRSTRAVDPFANHGINGEGGGESGVGSTSSAAGGSAGGAGGPGAGGSGAGSGAGGSGAGGSGAGSGAGGSGAGGSGGSGAGGSGGGGAGGGSGGDGGSGGGGGGGSGGGGGGGGGGGSGGGGSK